MTEATWQQQQISKIKRRNWQSTPGLLPGESHGHRSLVAHRVTKSRTRLSE